VQPIVFVAMLELLQFPKSAHDKAVQFFSSGMKQRLKLILALYADTPILLLDEPCSNLDKNGILWYRKTIFDMLGSRTILVASNQLDEYDFCAGRIEMHEFKNFQYL
jgi:ABC-type multidrug transport system ATPase subunit